jgi:PhnB protein
MKYGKQNGCGADFEDKVMHAALKIGDTLVMASDCPPGRYDKPQGFSVAVNFDQPEKAEHVFAQLAENGQINMPMSETFWAHRFGMLVDRFGTPWMIGCNKKEYSN